MPINTGPLIKTTYVVGPFVSNTDGSLTVTGTVNGQYYAVTINSSTVTQISQLSDTASVVQALIGILQQTAQAIVSPSAPPVPNNILSAQGTFSQ